MSYWPGRWPCEDGGPERHQVAPAGTGLGLGGGSGLRVDSRPAPAATMVVARDPGELYLLRHTGGDDAVCWVERIDPESLETRARSADLPGGPAWPGSIAVHANGTLYVVFGNHAHRLAPDLEVLATTELPRRRPYNGFVIMPDGCLVTKDFAGSRPGAPVPAGSRQACELVALEPERLGALDRCPLPEPSIARLSAGGDTVYVVGDTSLLRARWDGHLRHDRDFAGAYRTSQGQSYGWDCVLTEGAAWFLDDGEGSEAYDGTLRGHGVSTAPLRLQRVDLVTAQVSSAEVCASPGGLVANPPLIDPDRSIAVAYDSGNAVLQAFTVVDGALERRWQRRQSHGGHLLLYPDTGELVTGDHDEARQQDQVVVLDIDSGDELARADTGSPVQSVLFPAPGAGDDLYWCTFTTVSRLSVTGSGSVPG